MCLRLKHLWSCKARLNDAKLDHDLDIAGSKREMLSELGWAGTGKPSFLSQMEATPSILKKPRSKIHSREGVSGEIGYDERVKRSSSFQYYAHANNVALMPHRQSQAAWTLYHAPKHAFGLKSKSLRTKKTLVASKVDTCGCYDQARSVAQWINSFPKAFKSRVQYQLIAFCFKFSNVSVCE
ncbi:hypothetical protein VNO77_34867 [Canavalia gladiata]|uniref:Uncharacterized protein n=1 Tax=Canavalia gladiata TaxID=3824 RepID=A0AAN9KFK6_CANGL